MLVMLRQMYKPMQYVTGSSVALLSSYSVLSYIINDNNRHNQKYYQLHNKMN